MTAEEQPADIPDSEADAQDADDPTLLRERLEEAEREKDQFRTMAQRSQADLANYKKRVAQEMEETAREASSRLLLKIISVKDDLERALAMIPNETAAPGWAEGLRLVMRGIDSSLEAEGVSKTAALSMPFEPWEFEAVQYEETDEAEEGIVIKVLTEGYKHKGKVLRAAQVVVAKRPESSGHTGHTEDVEETL